jgi:cellulose synthase/poly-beta-1,6-N-acetylglucosamine synthase-like glycosyltransferase
MPVVSILIAAHNEADCIREKLENTLAFDYPLERLQILVGSDGSTDGTNEIAREYASRGVVLSAAGREGKASVLNRLAQLATGQLWLFSDANTMIAPDALRRLVRHFGDDSVGGVCGRLRLTTPAGAPVSEGVYWRYENLLKFYESRLGTIIGANGALYMLRRSEWHPLPSSTIVDDFVASMRVVLSGRRFVYDPAAVATEETATDLSGEFQRRVRISAGNFQALRELRPLLVKPTFSAFAFWSHKMLRWLAPFFMLLGLFANATLLRHGALYVLTLAAQVLLLMAALAPSDDLPAPLARPMATARYFVEMNAAIVVGLGRHLTRSQAATWRRTERTPVRRAA